MDSPSKRSTLPRPSGLPRPSRLPVPQSTFEPPVPIVPSKYRIGGPAVRPQTTQNAASSRERPIREVGAETEVQAQATHKKLRTAQGLDGASDVPQGRLEEVDTGKETLPRRRPRPSLSDRTIETLSQIPPSPSPRRRSSFFYPESPAGTPSRPPSSVGRSRPVTSLGQRPPIPSMAPRATSPTKRPVSPTKATPNRRAVSSYVPKSAQSITKARNTAVETTPSKSSRPTNGISLRPTAANNTAKLAPRPMGGSKTFAARSSKPRLAVGDAFKKPAMPSNDQARRDISGISTDSAKSIGSQSVFSTSRKSSQASQTSIETVSQPSATMSPPSKSSAALRETIAKAKAERRKAAGISKEPVHKADESVLPQSNKGLLSRRIDMARTDGRLNIAALGLSEFPNEVLKMYDLDTLDSGRGAWYESVDISRIIAADNQFRVLDERIFPDQSNDALENEDDETRGAVFGALESLDLHGNILEMIPIGLRRLEFLTVLNLSKNHLTNDSVTIIGQITCLKELRMAENALKGTLLPSILGLEQLEVLDIHGNAITDLPDAIEALVHLRILDVASNQLRSLPFDRLGSLPLTDLNISRNKLGSSLLPKGFDGLHSLKTLEISGNAITSIGHDPISLPELQILNVGENRLTTLPDISEWRNLTTLSAANNNVGAIPEGFTSLCKLRNVDFAGNNLKKLDESIGMMDNLISLSISNNPLRDRRFLSLSTDDVKKELRNRLLPPEIDTPDDPHVAVDVVSQQKLEGPSTWPVKPGGILDRSSTSLQSINSSDLEPLLDTAVKSFVLHHNLLSVIPSSITMLTSTLTVLDLSHNKLSGSSYLSDSLSLPKLRDLTLASNTLTSVQPLMNHLSAPTLRTLNISFNRITALPVLRATFPALTTILASDNAIPSIPLESAEGLQMLDVSRNDIAHLEPRLGLLEGQGLRTLGVEGNRFRVPRREIVEKGSGAVMEWLRGRIAEE